MRIWFRAAGSTGGPYTAAFKTQQKCPNGEHAARNVLMTYMITETSLLLYVKDKLGETIQVLFL